MSMVEEIGTAPLEAPAPTDETVGELSGYLTEQLISRKPRSLGWELTRGTLGLGLAGVFGLALGVRAGGASLAAHALGVPVGIGAVALIGVPSLFVFLTLKNAPISPFAMVTTTSRALGVTGMVLAGLAPAVALFVVTINSGLVAAAAGLAGLLLGGGIGLVHLLNGFSEELRRAPLTVRATGNAITALFAIFAVLLCGRIWFGLLPLLRGAL